MTSHEIWQDFCYKLNHDLLVDDDFTDDMRWYLHPWLSGESSNQRRRKFSSAPVKYIDNDYKSIIIADCPDGEYRFDFINRNNKYKLAFIECITLPISNINLPYFDFQPLTDKEIEIRCEKNFSMLISMYCKFKNLIGKDNAISQFLDGQGEFLCAKSWVPFYSDSLSYIAYAAWVEARIYGENIVIEKFTDKYCLVRFKQHLWRKMYDMTVHMKTKIEYSEYIELFEAIWRDRACSSGWSVNFQYDGKDTILAFKELT